MLLNHKIGLAAIMTTTLITGCSMNKPVDMSLERPAEVCSGIADAHNTMPMENNNESAFVASAPLSYVVKKGDTLWDISAKFLKSPWLWKQIWHSNPQIKNPNLIYPGDKLGIVRINGQKYLTITQPNGRYHGINTGKRTKSGLPIISYSPSNNAPGMPGASPAINGSLVAPFILKTRIVTGNDLVSYPQIFGDGRGLTLTLQDQFYTQGKATQKGETFAIYRVGDILQTTNAQTDQKEENKENLQYQMNYVGEAEVVKYDAGNGLTTLVPTKVVQPVKEHDVLLPVDKDDIGQAVLFPKLPNATCSRGYIVSNGRTDAMTINGYTTVAVSFGQDNGAEQGDVWKIQQPPTIRTINGKQVSIPGQDIGYLMIYKVYPKVSLAIILESKQPINFNDYLVRP